MGFRRWFRGFRVRFRDAGRESFPAGSWRHGGDGEVLGDGEAGPGGRERGSAGRGAGGGARRPGGAVRRAGGLGRGGIAVPRSRGAGEGDRAGGAGAAAAAAAGHVRHRQRPGGTGFRGHERGGDPARQRGRRPRPGPGQRVRAGPGHPAGLPQPPRAEPVPRRRPAGAARGPVLPGDAVPGGLPPGRRRVRAGAGGHRGPPRRHRREPANLQVQRDLSTNYCHLGDLVGRSDPAAAREWYEQSLKIDQSLAEKEPDNPQAQRELSISYIRLGDLARRSDPATARTWYEQSLGIRKRLAEAERNGADGRELLADCFGRLAVTLREGGLLTEANCGYQQALELFAEAERSSPGNPGPFYSRACIHAIWGASEQALQALQQAVELRYDDADWVANDPDFAALRGMSEFEQLLMRMRQRSAAIL